MVGWHNFRYTYSTWADPSGDSIKALQNQLGHTDSLLTLSVYTQPIPEAQRQLANKIARVLLPGCSQIQPRGSRGKRGNPMKANGAPGMTRTCDLLVRRCTGRRPLLPRASTINAQPACLGRNRPWFPPGSIAVAPLVATLPEPVNRQRNSISSLEVDLTNGSDRTASAIMCPVWFMIGFGKYPSIPLVRIF
jgi:hypothetical protein